MSEEFIMKKSIDKSVFNRGFAIPVKTQDVLALHLSGGRLAHGEKRDIKIILNDETHLVTLTSVNFNRGQHPGHSDMWQIVYPPNSTMAKSIAKIFAQSLNLLQEKNRDTNFILPAIEPEYFVLYATDSKDTFCLEPIFNSENLPFGTDADELSFENLFELPHLTDSEAEIIAKYHLTKIRKLNRSIGNYLKKMYDFRCQICGQSMGDIYGAKVAECHHIKYFVQSLNNDVDNLLVVCPNHHRIIHATNPVFDRKKKIYRYPNGYEEGLKLDLHFRRDSNAKITCVEFLA